MSRTKLSMITIKLLCMKNKGHTIIVWWLTPYYQYKYKHEYKYEYECKYKYKCKYKYMRMHMFMYVHIHSYIWYYSHKIWRRMSIGFTPSTYQCQERDGICCTKWRHLLTFIEHQILGFRFLCRLSSHMRRLIFQIAGDLLLRGRTKHRHVWMRTSIISTLSIFSTLKVSWKCLIRFTASVSSTLRLWRDKCRKRTRHACFGDIIDVVAIDMYNRLVIGFYAACVNT